jgi:hypothetical protein
MPYLNHCTAGFSGETSLLVLETAPAAAEKIKGFCIAKPMQKPRWIEPGRDRGLTEVYGIFRMRSCALAGWAAACVYAFTSRLVPGCGRRLAAPYTAIVGTRFCRGSSNNRLIWELNRAGEFRILLEIALTQLIVREILTP